MPMWDETTPFTERETAPGRLSAVRLFILLNIVGLALPAGHLLFGWPDWESLLVFDGRHAIRELRVWQFITYPFWHRIDPNHAPVDTAWCALGFIGVWWILSRFGRELEREWGWRRFSTFFLASALYGALAHAFTQTVVPSVGPAFGPVGPALAVMLAAALSAPHARVHFLFVLELRAIPATLVFLALGIVYSLARTPVGMTPVALLGAVAAAALIIHAEPRVDTFLNARQAGLMRQRVLDEFEIKRRVDALLEKISREGMDNLSAAERRLLKRASRFYSDSRRDRHE
ncbi:MAG: rhomboid family intramembrane serine protease [Planctomycetes bacterium]|nr:rhomboid family intramembrane serine protease [Planctomycetota bacterium]